MYLYNCGCISLSTEKENMRQSTRLNSRKHLDKEDFINCNIFCLNMKNRTVHIFFWMLSDIHKDSGKHLMYLPPHESYFGDTILEY